MDDDRLEFLAQITSWYYEDGLSQEEIARRVGKSPSMISRLIQEARESNLVEISVRFPLKRHSLLEGELGRAFGLREAWVLANPPGDPSLILERVGQLGARCLQGHLRSGISAGVTWGTIILEVVRAMRPHHLVNATVIQIAGSVGAGDPVVDGTQVTRGLADKLGASTVYIPAPLVVRSEELASSLRQDPAVAEALRRAAQIDLALLGVGTTDLRTAGLLRAGYVSPDELRAMREAGAVGDILGHHFDILGRILDIPINRRLIALPAERLRAVPLTLLVTAGASKVEAALGALRGGFANTFVTDVQTAEAVLRLAQAGPAARLADLSAA